MCLVLPVKDHKRYNQKYRKPLLEIFIENLFFGSKKNMNYQIKFTLNLL